MHTILVLSGGLALLLVFVVAARVLGDRAGAAGRAARVFVPLWFLAAAVNMWVGVSRAGYSVAAEAPIFLVVFGLPAAVAIAVARLSQ